MPVCPKCHKLITEERWERHLKRCGVYHDDGPKQYVVPPYAGNVADSHGRLVRPTGTLTRRQRFYLILILVLLAGGGGALLLVEVVFRLL
ncbi:MAG: hypothetical protein OK456_09445 [Thaumarchaeota archaeon]|nr:hypothetical protein [Nitrososphaerota archaeon]